jgi:transposase-like protein
VRELGVDGPLPTSTRLWSSKHPNNLIEQDQRGVKQRIAVMSGFKCYRHDGIAIGGIELMRCIRKGQFWLGAQGRTAPAVWNAVIGA